MKIHLQVEDISDAALYTLGDFQTAGLPCRSVFLSASLNYYEAEPHNHYKTSVGPGKKPGDLNAIGSHLRAM